MLAFLPVPLVALIAFSLYWLAIAVLGSWFFIMFLLTWITPVPAWRRTLQRWIFQLPSVWSDTMRYTAALTTRTQWDIEGLEQLNKNESYLLISNHQGFIDIAVLQMLLDPHVPQLRYFMKQQLLYVPILGQACYLMGYPFMHRYTQAYLAQHPEKQNRDLETTRKACERFGNAPITLINYVEGTRRTPQKQRKQKFPYKNLLRPKAGGIAFILAALEQKVHTILNVTIVYSQPRHASWTFLSGRMRRITVRIEKIPVTPELIGDYQNDAGFRENFQNWLNALWQRKDDLIEAIRTRGKNH